MLTAFGHLAPSCCVHLSPSALRLVINPAYGGTDNVYAFFSCALDTVLEQAKVESKSGNDILFVASIPALLKAVRSAEPYDRRVIKLAKKDGRAYLTFDLHAALDASQLSTSSLPSTSSTPSQLSLTQDVPIIVLPPGSQGTSAEPDLSSPSVRVHLPHLHAFHTAIDRLHPLPAQHLVRLRLSNAGTLQVTARDELTELHMHWKGLALDMGQASERTGEADVLIDGRKLSAALHCRALNLVTCIACVVDRECLIVYGKVKEKRGTVTYFLPLVIDS